MNRREFLQWTAAVTAAHAARQRLYGASVGPPPYFGLSPRALMTQFVQALPTKIPAVQGGVGTTIPIVMRQFTHVFHPGLGPTNVWGYTTPDVPVVHLGPTIEARSGVGFAVSYSNQLPAAAPLVPQDYAVADMTDPSIRTVVHLHGGHVPPDSDGWPEDWLVQGQTDQGRDYPNDQESAMLWYHDHALGITRLNVLSGLAALWIIRDDVEDGLGLPGGPADQTQPLDTYGNPYEIPLVIQDKVFQASGQLGYPGALSPLPSALGGFTSWAPEFFGDVALVNGKAWPYLQVEPRRYRLRILNGSNARFYRLSIPGVAFNVIGLEAGLLPRVVTLQSLLVAPAERFDVIVDFSKLRGKTVIMTNTANAPFPGGNGRPNLANPTAATTGNVLQIRVGTTVTKAAPAMPVTLTGYAPLPAPAVTRAITLEELLGADGAPLKLLINGAAWNTMEGTGLLADVTENPANKAVEVWEFINLTADVHPMHVHLVRFQVLNRIPFNVGGYLKDLAAFRAGVGPAPVYKATGKPVKPGLDESPGWKDTVKAMPGMVTRIAAKFELGTSAVWVPAKGAGSHRDTYRYPYHCHIVDHEDNAMMRPFIVRK